MPILLINLAFFLSFLLVLISVPPILRVARAKKLFDSFDERKIHTGSIPPLGGVALFIGFVLSTIISTDGLSFDSLKYIIAAVILMFFIGLKDDLMAISASKKFIVQLFAVVVLITLGNIRITNLHGIFGLYEIGYGQSLSLSIFAMIAIINSFNLIDGIDGLASGLAMLASAVLGIWFFMVKEVQFSIMSFAMLGSLSGFFLFNVFGHRNKLFMGDTGSLIVGLIVSTIVIKFNEFNIPNTIPYAVKAAPVVSFAIVIIPLIDTLRVITIRISQKKSPFSPDRNHIHHRLLMLVPSHFKVTLILIAVNLCFVGFALFLNKISFNINFQFLILFFTAILFSFIPSLLIRFSSLKKEKSPKLNFNYK